MTTATIKPPEVKQTRMLIGGEWCDAASGKTFESVNPATGEVIAQVAEGHAEDIDRAVKAARKAFDSGPWPKMSGRDRGKLLFKLADLVEQNAEELTGLEVLDNGKPISEVKYVDIPQVLATLRYFAGWADKIYGDVVPVDNKLGNFFVYTRKEPVGVCGQIIPWNFPMLMMVWKWAPALTCGNTVVLKPAEQTPLTALRIGELALEAGFPPGVVNIVPGFGETAGDALVKHEDVDKIAFTGEYKTAQIIQVNAAPTLKRLTFELGGKSPDIVFADANMKRAAAGAMAASLLLGCTGDAPPPAPAETATATAKQPPASPAPTEAATPSPTPAPTITIAAVGDLMFARDVTTLMQQHGAAYPFERVLPLFEGADLLIGNLEGTFTDRGEPLDKPTVADLLKAEARKDQAAAPEPAARKDPETPPDALPSPA